MLLYRFTPPWNHYLISIIFFKYLRSFPTIYNPFPTFNCSSKNHSSTSIHFKQLSKSIDSQYFQVFTMAKIFLLVVLFALATTQCLAIRRPPLPSLDPKQVQCFDSMKKSNPCFDQVGLSFKIGKPSVEPQCCVALWKTEKDCLNISFGSIKMTSMSPFLNVFCPNGEGATPPSV